MKYIFIAMLLMTTGFVMGQIVNIPDSNFKNYLTHYENIGSNPIDINHDNEIQLSEALAIDTLEIGERHITDFTGIEAFSNIQRLGVYGNIAPYLDLSNMNQLTFLDIGSGVKTINFSGCINLKILYLNNCDSIKTLDISECRALIRLECNSNDNFDSLITGVHDSLSIMSLYANILRNIDLTGCKNLRALYIYSRELKKLNCHGLNNLEIVAELNYGNSIDFSGCSKLNTLSYLGLGNMGDDMSFNLSGCSSLTDLYIQCGLLPELDLSSCINLSRLILHSPGLKHLNLKNGSTLTDFADIRTSDSAVICADDFELGELRDNIEPYNTAENHIQFTSNCTFFPGGKYNTISGKARIDANGNGCDSTDRVMQQVAIKIQDTAGNSLVRYTASSGDYAHYSYNGVFSLTPYFPYPYFTVNPNAASVSFDTANNLTSVKDFCIQPTGIHNDLEISLLPIFPPARPGFDAAYTLVYKNRGTSTLAGNVQVNFDNNKVNFVAASNPVTTQSPGQLVWNYSNLLPFESRTVNVTLNLLPPPVNNIGDTINYLAAITPSANDETAFDNSFVLPQLVRGSFDPNDKQCLEGSQLDISKIGDYLHYVIHFQNEGTDTAFNIVVADTLSNNLDWNSFEFIKSSHAADVRLTNNKAEFIFENIQLPYKTIDEPGSQGWVAFKIKPKPSVVIGDSINYNASIYFDFNMPVMTSKGSTVVSSASTPLPVKLEYFSVNSRNNTNTLNWKVSNNYGTAAFIIERSDDGIHFSAIGNTSATALRCQLPFNFTDNNPVAGKNYYRLKITDADGIAFYSKTLMIGNGKAGIAITSIANDIVYLNSDKQQSIQIKIIAADGKELLNERQNIVAGSNTFILSMKNKPTGIYTLLLYSNDTGVITRRFIK